MWVVVAVLLYLAIAKEFEPLLLVPIAFGALLANLPTEGIINAPAEPALANATGELVYVIPHAGDEINMPKVPVHKTDFIRKDSTGRSNRIVEQCRAGCCDSPRRSSRR